MATRQARHRYAARDAKLIYGGGLIHWNSTRSSRSSGSKRSSRFFRF
jgi:hypothetical protein